MYENTTDENIASVLKKIDPFAVVKHMPRVLKNGDFKKTTAYYVFCPTCSQKGFKADKKLRKGSVIICPLCGEKIKLNERPYYEHTVNTMLKKQSGLPFWKYENIKNDKFKLSMFSVEWTIELVLDPLLRFSYISIIPLSYCFSFNKKTRILYYIEKDQKRNSKIKNITYGGEFKGTTISNIITGKELIDSANRIKFPQLLLQYFDILSNYCKTPRWAEQKNYDLFDLYAGEKYPGLFYLINKTPMTRSLRLASRRSKKILQESQSSKEILERVSQVKVFKSEFSMIEKLERPAAEFYLFYRSFISDANKRRHILEKLQGKRWYDPIIYDYDGNEYERIKDSDPDLYPVPSFLNARKKKRNGVYNFVKKMNRCNCKEYTENILFVAILDELDKYSESDTLNSLYSLIATIRDVSESLELLETRYQRFDPMVRSKCKNIIKNTTHIQQLEHNLNVYIRQLKLLYPDNTTITIGYNKSEKEKYNRHVGEYLFTLAESNTEMEVVGDELQICVGDHVYYFNCAERKQLYIVFVRDRIGNTMCTLEISNRNKLIQAKGKYNNKNFPLDESVVSAIKVYCSKNEINWQNTNDIK